MYTVFHRCHCGTQIPTPCRKRLQGLFTLGKREKRGGEMAECMSRKCKIQGSSACPIIGLVTAACVASALCMMHDIVLKGNRHETVMSPTFVTDCVYRQRSDFRSLNIPSDECKGSYVHIRSYLMWWMSIYGLCRNLPQVTPNCLPNTGPHPEFLQQSDQSMT